MNQLAALVNQIVRRLLWRLDFVSQSIFDWRFGTETARQVEREAIVTDSGNRDLGWNYEATDSSNFKRMIERVTGKRESLTFIDFGSGKGRACLLAARLGFRRVIGVEYSPDLVKIAENNARVFSPEIPNATVEFVVGDAAAFPIPKTDCVFYFFNPFREAVMAQVLDNINAALSENGSRSFAILCNCAKAHHALVLASRHFVPIARDEQRRNWLGKMMHGWTVYGPPR
jgi:SAM-dependent methyltransferase